MAEITMTSLHHHHPEVDPAFPCSYCCFQYSCNSSRASFFCSKCLNFCASDYSLNSQYFFMIFVAMYLYNVFLDAGTNIMIKFSVLTKLEKWPSESVCKELLPHFLLF